MERILKAVCCVCGKIYREGETINGHVTHGYCPEHYYEIMAEIISENPGEELNDTN